MQISIYQAEAYLIQHGYKISKVGNNWQITDPLDDPKEGYHLVMKDKNKLIMEAFEFLVNCAISYKDR